VFKLARSLEGNFTRHLRVTTGAGMPAYHKNRGWLYVYRRKWKLGDILRRRWRHVAVDDVILAAGDNGRQVSPAIHDRIASAFVRRRHRISVASLALSDDSRAPFGTD